MGQATSKGLTVAAGNAVKRVTDWKPPRPPITNRPSPRPGTGGGNNVHDHDNGATVDAANPSNFLRGEGIATHDVRDVGQAMYLQHVRKSQREAVSRGGRADIAGAAGVAPDNNNNNKTDANGPADQNPDMPPDLLKFIQDVGPATRSVDEDFTSPRLLREENRADLEKGESVRRPPTRRRTRMPLMGDDDTFTTEKNTNFASTSLTSSSQERRQREETDFGITDQQLYTLLSEKGRRWAVDPNTSGDDGGETDIVNDFYRTVTASDNNDGTATSWTADEEKKHREWLVQTLRVLDLPTLRMDSENNILGLYPHEVPGPEVKSVRPIPETKVMLVLKDLVVNVGGGGGGNTVGGDGSADAGMASKQLSDRRRERVARSGAIK